MGSKATYNPGASNRLFTLQASLFPLVFCVQRFLFDFKHRFSLGFFVQRFSFGSAFRPVSGVLAYLIGEQIGGSGSLGTPYLLERVAQVLGGSIN